MLKCFVYFEKLEVYYKDNLQLVKLFTQIELTNSMHIRGTVLVHYERAHFSFSIIIHIKALYQYFFLKYFTWKRQDKFYGKLYVHVPGHAAVHTAK